MDSQNLMQPQGVQFVEISQDNAGQRLDNYLLNRLKGLPRSRLYRLIRKGEVRINKKRCKPEDRLDTGDVVRIPPVRLSAAEPAPRPSPGLSKLIRASVLFDNEDLMVINKPQSLAVHGGSGLKTGLIEAMRHIYPEYRYLELVHRIDRDTSGCLVIAKNPRVLKYLHAQLKEKTMSKSYQALVHGKWPSSLKEINAPLLKNEVKSGERIVTVDSQGKSALTRFSVIQHFQSATLVEASPVTGRTHQIRVHCQHGGHPIVGDQKYSYAASGPLADVKNLCLHAARIGFNLPDEERVFSIAAPMNNLMSTLIADLKRAG